MFGHFYYGYAILDILHLRTNDAKLLNIVAVMF